ncbi:YicC/YloC family endoribonuclease [Hymenobacter actinosclerus]|uniref:TIGR00255 family protein n=1 Tax=Hymenobacter actinosclerus TaxID=82805 RepID=A0A1H9ZKD5_9BACT|nr:YicC/YloC family endoribonuclease [Hymenobacter actinosclerus]SES82080.1 TIGR00255 family protein [Hymenobacter actinosclerus]
MLQSMTGYGIATRETDHYAATVEIKSLNSKSFDLTLRLPRFLQDKELEIRNLLAKSLVRGKVNLNLDFARPRATATGGSIVNEAAVRAACQELQALSLRTGLSLEQVTAVAHALPGSLRLPAADATAAAAEPLETETSWDELLPLLHEALERLHEFRRAEGRALTAEILGYVEHISRLLAEVERHDPSRVAQVRQRLQSHLADISANEHFNSIRFEQEILHYIEKLDIAEEKVRLGNHLRYFIETAHLPEPTGKKLAFISQEIGREINTIGSKANDSAMQHLVVSMKEELEKIKEQINNIL